VQKETAVRSIVYNDELYEEVNKLEDKVRPTDITKFSKYSIEREVLFGPLSSFIIDEIPRKFESE
jgi:hypothetical protein